MGREDCRFMSAERTGRILPWACLAVVVITLIAFAPAWKNDFVNYDDNMYVVENPHVVNGLTSEDIRWAFTAAHAANWHPLTWLSLQLDAQWYGERPTGYHVTSVLLHAIN